MIRAVKPWVIGRADWKTGPRLAVLSKLAATTNKVICIAKPSENLYLGNSAKESILNLASHGEMSVGEIFPAESAPAAERLINLLPTRIRLEQPTGEILMYGKREGKYLNHFGYRKIVMNFQPETMADHAWIACALSYSVTPDSNLPFDEIGGGIAGGIAAITKKGGIFRGSGVKDKYGIVATPLESLHVSLSANAEDISDISDTYECSTEEFFKHSFFRQLQRSV